MLKIETNQDVVLVFDNILNNASPEKFEETRSFLIENYKFIPNYLKALKYKEELVAHIFSKCHVEKFIADKKK